MSSYSVVNAKLYKAKQLLKYRIIESIRFTFRHLPILHIRKDLFDYENNAWKSFYIPPKDLSWMDTLSGRIQECLRNNPNLIELYHELLSKQTLPVGMVLSAGRTGTRALSEFMNCSPHISSLHRLSDIEEFQDYNFTPDKRIRNTIIYSFMLGKYSDEWLEEQIQYTLDMIGYAIEISNKNDTEFWYSAHRWNCYYPIIRVLFPQHKLIYLSRDPFKIVCSMVIKDQYGSSAAPDVERTWTNFEPMDTKTLQTENLKLRLTSATQFDRIAWYINFVKYLHHAFISKFTGIAHCEFSIDAASEGSREAYERLRSVANLEGLNYSMYREFFRTKINVKRPILSVILRFPEVERWDNKLISRYEDISGTFMF